MTFISTIMRFARYNILQMNDDTWIAGDGFTTRVGRRSERTVGRRMLAIHRERRLKKFAQKRKGSFDQEYD